MLAQSNRLQTENRQYAGTGGVSEHNQSAGFIPAFKHSESGEVAFSRFKDGRIAPCHLLDGLPEHWVERDQQGKAIEINACVISGFVRLGEFFTRQEAAALIA